MQTVNGAAGQPIAVFDNAEWVAVGESGDSAGVYGFGLFETLRIEAATVPLWRWHWARLSESAQRLGLQLAQAQVDVLLARCCSAAVAGRGVVKLLVTAPDVGRGYRVEPQLARLEAQLFQAPALVSGPGLRLQRTAVQLPSDPLMAGMKSLSCSHYVLARRELGNSWDDLLLCDWRGQPLETCSSNLWLRQGDDLLTPATDHSGVAGVARRWLQEQFEASGEGRLHCRPLNLDELMDADEVFISNAVLGFRPVVEIQDLGHWRPGTCCEAWQRRLAETMGVTL